MFPGKNKKKRWNKKEDLSRPQKRPFWNAHLGEFSGYVQKWLLVFMVSFCSHETIHRKTQNKLFVKHFGWTTTQKKIIQGVWTKNSQKTKRRDAKTLEHLNCSSDITKKNGERGKGNDFVWKKCQTWLFGYLWGRFLGLSLSPSTHFVEKKPPRKKSRSFWKEKCLQTNFFRRVAFCCIPISNCPFVSHVWGILFPKNFKKGQ